MVAETSKLGFCVVGGVFETTQVTGKVASVLGSTSPGPLPVGVTRVQMMMLSCVGSPDARAGYGFKFRGLHSSTFQLNLSHV